MRIIKLGFLLTTIALLSACASSSVVVKASIPTPLVERLPLTAHINYTDAFNSYTYEEAEKKRALKSMNFGAAQLTLFDTVFSNLLTLVDSPSSPTTADAESELSDDAKLEDTGGEVVNTVALENLSSVNRPDLIIEPEILDFQYTAPRETKLKLYEVWIKYRLRITGSADEELADWVVKGYGKTPTALLASATSAFNSATNIALRDVGAQLSIGFKTQPSIASLLASRKAQSSLSDDASEEASAELSSEEN